MSLDKILILIIGTGLIGFIWWFFFGKKPSTASATEGQGSIEIVVEGGYNPSVIKIPKATTTKLTFIRKDENSCLEDVVIPDFKIKKYLPMGERVQVSLTPEKVGEYEIHCGMNMFHGKILVT